MAVYTYVGNKNQGEVTAQLILRGGDLVINKGQYADITPEELAAVSVRYDFQSGIVGGALPAGPNYPDLYNFLNPVAIDQLIAEVSDSGSVAIVTGPGTNGQYLRANGDGTYTPTSFGAPDNTYDGGTP